MTAFEQGWKVVKIADRTEDCPMCGSDDTHYLKHRSDCLEGCNECDASWYCYDRQEGVEEMLDLGSGAWSNFYADNPEYEGDEGMTNIVPYNDRIGGHYNFDNNKTSTKCSGCKEKLSAPIFRRTDGSIVCSKCNDALGRSAYREDSEGDSRRHAAYRESRQGRESP